MRFISRISPVLIGSFAVALFAGVAGADDSVSLKAGETADLGALFWVTNCHSLLKGPPVAEVMEGPAELSTSVKAQPVLPRKFNCAKPVAGGELFVTAAKEIKARLEGKMFVRIKYPTKDGERQASRQINYVLFPDPSPASPKAP